MRTALVTGATSGIGRAAALALGDAGWWVLACGRDLERGAEVAAELFEPLADAAISVDTIVQNASVQKLADLSFTVERDDLDTATEVISGLDGVSAGIETDERIGKVSIVGAGMRRVHRR